MPFGIVRKNLFVVYLKILKNVGKLLIVAFSAQKLLAEEYDFFQIILGIRGGYGQVLRIGNFCFEPVKIIDILLEQIQDKGVDYLAFRLSFRYGSVYKVQGSLIFTEKENVTAAAVCYDFGEVVVIAVDIIPVEGKKVITFKFFEGFGFSLLQILCDSVVHIGSDLIYIIN